MDKRINKAELLSLLETLMIGKEEYWVLSSGALVLRGIYKDAGDLAIAITDEGLRQLKSKYNLKQKDNGWFIISDKIECVCDGEKEKLKYSPEKVGEYYVQNIEEYYEYLIKSEREKDKKRIPLVEEYINNCKENLKIYNIIDKLEYLKEVASLEYYEWADNPNNNPTERINNKMKKIEKTLNKKNFCKLILLNGKNLVGFISLFPSDCKEHEELTPWYATMYVKKEFRGNGYSKILNNAILEEAHKRGFKKVYLKTELVNYYEKFDAKFISNINLNEKLYKIEL